MADLTVAAGAVRALMEFAISRGADRAALAGRAGLDLPDLCDRDERIAFARYVALMRAGQELCGDPALALHFGESVPVTAFAISCQVGAYSESMPEGLALMNRYAPLTVEVAVAGNGDRFTFERGDGVVWIVDNREDPNDFPELTESAFARMICTGRAAFGDGPFLKAVHVTHPQPSYRAEYDRIFRVPVTFGSRRNALLADDFWMDLTPPTPSAPMLEALKTHSEALLRKLEQAKSTRGAVEQSLARRLADGEPGMDAVARDVGVGRASLFRRLKAEGVTFEQVLDEVRHRLAMRCLVDEELSVKETAFRLGFSEAASFSRAFKRWTGTSPLEARRGKAGVSGPRPS